MRDPRFDREYWRGPEQPPSEEELAEAHAHALTVAQNIPDRKAFEDLFEWQNRSEFDSLEAFESALVATLQAQPQPLAAWVTALRATIDAEVETYRERQWFVAYVDAWIEEKNPFAVWDRSFSYELRLIDSQDRSNSEFLFFLVDLLGRLDRNRWFEILDAFPFPNFAYTALWESSGLVYDRALIEDLLRTAPHTLGPDGEWLPPHRVTMLLLLNMIVSHADFLWDAVSQDQRQRLFHGDDEEKKGPNVVDELTPLRNDELPNWMRSGFRLVLERPDGQALLIGYLAHLCGGQSMSYHRNEYWDARDCARNILAEELALRGTSVHQVKTVWNRSGASAPTPQKEAMKSTSSRRRFAQHEGEGARGSSTEGGPFLYAAARIVEKSGNVATEVIDLWSFLAERLLARDQIIRYFGRQDDAYDGPNLFGRLCAYLPAPKEAIQRLYTQLEPQRRRALHWLHYEHDHDAEEPSQFLLHVGLYACASRETWPENAARHELFGWLYDAARRIWLTSRTSWSSADDPERLLVARFFAYMPEVFGDKLNDALARALAPIRNEAWLISMAGAFLWRNGIEATEVRRLFQNVGIHLPTALRDAHQWVAISENRQGRVDPSASEFPPIAHAFAKALQVDFENALPAPQRRSLQNEFRSTIPWGSALWKSLEAEGHTNIRVYLLAAQTWMLQTTVPESLRQRFGLSPDIRILAVHGQIVGRDVRLALAKPEDASAIDPDLLVVVCDHPDFAQRVAKRIPGPFGQRIPWIPSPKNEFPPLSEVFREHAGRLDLFEYRDPVHGNALIGRDREIDELTQRLLRGEAVGVFGLRKVGKSSLMEAVAERLDPIGAHLGMFRFYGHEVPDMAAPTALVVSFDAQSVGAKSLSNLVLRLIDYLDERLKWAGLPNVKDSRFDTMDPLDHFRYKLARALERLSLPICFMIDEYDLLFAGYDGAGELPGIEKLFAILRAEANASRRVSLALVGRDPAFVDEPHLGYVTNPLLGWVHHQYLGPFRHNESDDLLVRLGKRVGLEVGAKSIESGWRLTGGHPLLLRQYGSALFELAHAPGSRPRPIPTDPVCLEAVDVFPTRDAVRTILGEIGTLLAVRSPASLTLLRALASADSRHADRVVAEHGGAHSRALRTLLNFGIVQVENGRVWVPKVFGDEFGLDSAREAYEVAGEEE